MRGGLSPFSGLICEIVNSVGRGNFTLILPGAGEYFLIRG